MLGVVGVVALATVVGCKKKDEGQDPNAAGYQPGGGYPPQGGYAGNQGGYGAQPGAQPTAPPPATTPPPAGTTPPAAGGQAQPVDPSLAAGAQQVLNGLAQQKAVAGSKPVGSALAGNFQQGQVLETQINLQPNKCYTAIGAGLPPIGEVNVKFLAVTPIPGSAMILAQDQGTGSQAVLGEKPNCYKNPTPIPIPVKMVLEVTSGSGIAAAQLYEK
jgi:hypothetical protein